MIRRILLILFSLLAFAAQPKTAAAVEPEIVELARALGNDPDLIYEYVHNHIDTLPQYGSLKGPLGALIDGNGTAFDQAELMFQLLQQAGYSPSYQFGQINLTAAQVENWTGVDQHGLQRLLAHGGIPATRHLDPSGNLVSVDLGWVWIAVAIGGTTYAFDPSTKSYDRTTPLANLASILGYTKSSFIANAESGTTITSYSISNLNRANIRSNLTQFANNLISHIQSNTPAASTADIIGGETIDPIPFYAPPLRQTSLPNAVGPVTTASSIPSSDRATLRFTIPGASGNPFVFNSSDLYGRRLTIFFNSSLRPVLYLDGTAVPGGTGSPASGNPASVTLQVQISHPYGATVTNPACMVNPVSFADQCGPMPVEAGATGAPAAHVIVNEWGTPTRAMIERYRRGLLNYVASQASPDPASVPILGDSLAILSATYMAEHAQIRQITGRLLGTVILGQHLIGTIGLSSLGTGLRGPAVNLWFYSLSTVQASNRPSGGSPNPMEVAAIWADSMTGSVLESAVIDHTQAGVSGVSTTKLVDLAMQSFSMFDINNNGVPGDDAAFYNSTIRPQFTGYQSNALNAIDAAVASGARVIAPKNGSLTINQWTGAGWYFTGSNQIHGVGGMISGLLKGGAGSSPETAAQLTGNAANTCTAGSDSYTNTVLGVSQGGSWGQLPVGGDPAHGGQTELRVDWGNLPSLGVFAEGCR